MKNKKVKSGQKIKIIANEWNQTRSAAAEFLEKRPLEGIGASKNIIPSQTVVSVINTTTEAFDSYEIAVIDKPAVSPDDNDNDFFIDPNFEIKKAQGTETEKPVILLEPANPDNSFSRAIIDGTATIKIKINSVGDQYAKTAAGKTYLESANTGQFKIIWKSATADSNGLVWAFVAFQAPAGTDYNGYFKVIKDGDNYKVVDGGNPDAAYCGYVRIGNARNPLYKATLTGISGDGCFYIETTYTTYYQISIKFASALPTAEDGKDICLIADLIGGEIYQRLRNEHAIVRWV